LRTLDVNNTFNDRFGFGEEQVFVRNTNPGPRAACQAIDGEVRADALFRGPPVIANVRGDDLRCLDAGIDTIVELPMVTDTETHIVRPIDGIRPQNQGKSNLEIALDTGAGGEYDFYPPRKTAVRPERPGSPENESRAGRETGP
jgi:hypothetical protein